MPKKPKQNDLSKLWGYIKKSEPVQNLVNSAKNTRKGRRPRVSVPGKSTADPEVSKVTIVKDNPLIKQTVSLPEFKPYYVSDENPNVLTPAQQAMRDELVKSRQIDLAQYQRELARQGVNTPASHRRATALAVETNPNAILAPPEGPFKLPYRTWYRTGEPVITNVDGKPIMTAEQSPIMVEGETMKDWYDVAGEGILPQGPNASWRKLEIPFQQATSSFDVAGQQRAARQPAYSLTMRKLGEGLEGLASKYLGIEPLQAKQVQIRKPYVTPGTNVVSNHIGPDMGPGLYGYDVSTKGWRPLAEFSVEHTLGKPDKYSMFSQIGEPSSIKFDSNDIIENGVNFEGTPFSVIQNTPIEQKTYDFNPFWGWKLNKNFNVLWGKKPPYLKQGGVLFAKSGIHIKKANRGKFTDYCGGKVTSECIARGKASSSPTIRKRATFAANARKWKHKNGGIIPFWVHDILGGE